MILLRFLYYVQKEHSNKEQEELEVDLQCERLYSSQNTVVEVCVFNIPNGPTLLYCIVEGPGFGFWVLDLAEPVHGRGLVVVRCIVELDRLVC